MSVLLAVEVSPRFENSVSRRVTGEFIARWEAAHAAGTVIRRDLAKTPPPFVDGCWIRAAFTAEPERSAAMRAALRASDECIAEVMAAEHIVIGTPVYNFSIPAALKAYIDQIARVGATVTAQYEGMLQGKRATVILASASSFAAGSRCESSNGAGDYLKLILGFLGIGEVNVVAAADTLALESGEVAFGDMLAKLDDQLWSAARR